MFVLTLALAPGVDVFGGARSDPLGPKAYPPVYVPVESPFGYLYRPAFDLHAVPRPPAVPYTPKAGDVLLLSDPDPLFDVLYVFAKSGKPGHCAIVVTMPDGRPGMLEAGFSFTPWTRLTPLDYAISLYAGNVWVRPREVPLTPDEDRRLTEFAMQANGGAYNKKRFANQLTLFRSRNPIVTRFAGKPVGPGKTYTCVQIVVEAMVYAGLIDAKTARPAATYAQDLFYDRSRNPYIDRHPPMAGRGWGAPQLWTPIPGAALRGRDRPQPPAPWPGEGGAFVVVPTPNGGSLPPTPTIVGSTPGDPSAMPAVVSSKQRIGFFDRPDRLFRLRR
ncbi:hypothetical protein [Limnoglobus roseus]|nr:hypothetical protein [Limnoglobus roseus]